MEHKDINKRLIINSRSYDGVQKASAYNYYGNYARVFPNTDTNIGIKSEFTRNDYNYYRPSEEIPQRQEDIIYMCMKAYDRVGIIRNVIDLMGDFACQGITLVHPNKQIEKFYQKWFKKVNGKERSERFLNTLYRLGNVIIRRFDGKLTSSMVEDWRKAYGSSATDIDAEFTTPETKRYVIPAKYIIYNPLTVEAVGGELSAFIGKPILGLKITSSLRTLITKYDNLSYRGDLSGLTNSIPDDLKASISAGATYHPLDQDKLSVFYYKKDDWQLWANPMIASVLGDLIQLDKMKLADSAALDGAISNIRLWRLGIIDTTNIQNSIFPNRAGINKLRDILSKNVGGGTMDLVWGPELDFKESSTQVHNFLGPDKYQVVLACIYVGLGIPPMLTGSSKDGGYTNNYLAIKTLIERLEYGRDRLVEFWTQEIERVQKAMGFRFPAQINFDQMILSDEAAEKTLLVNLVDRGLISEETLRGKFDLLSDIEKIRIKREHAEHGEAMPPKASPFHNPQTKDDLTKQFVQHGTVAPSQVGLNLPDKKPDEITPNDNKLDMQTKIAQTKVAQQKYAPGKTPNGRPKNAKDSTKRKKKRVLPKTKGFINVYHWATAAQEKISEVLTPVMLGVWGKKNLRMLTAEQLDDLENLKFHTLAAIEPLTKISDEMVYNTLAKTFETNAELDGAYKILLGHFMSENDKLPVISELRQIQAYAYSIINSEDEEDVEDSSDSGYGD